MSVWALTETLPIHVGPIATLADGSAGMVRGVPKFGHISM